MAALNKSYILMIILLTLGFSSASRHLRETNQKISALLSSNGSGIGGGMGLGSGGNSVGGFGIGTGSGGNSNNNNRVTAPPGGGNGGGGGGGGGQGEVIVNFPHVNVPGISIPPISIPGIPGAIIPGIGLPGVVIGGGGVQVGPGGKLVVQNDPPPPCALFIPGIGCVDPPEEPVVPSPPGIKNGGSSIQSDHAEHEKTD